MSFIAFVNGTIFLFFGALMALDALLFPGTAGVFLKAAVLTSVFGGLICIAASSKMQDIKRKHAFMLTTTVWLSAALAGAAPLFLWSLSPTDAFFESMSGITTTGSTVMTGLDTTPRGILFWRALLQGVGGIGFIVTGIALLPFLKVGGMQLFRTESSDKGDKELKSAAAFSVATLEIYLGLIVACALIYIIGGMNPFDAVTHAMSTLSTGGYSGYDASFGHFQSSFLEWAATGFMLAGALPFSWYIRLYYKRTARSEQVRAMMISLALIIPAMALWLSLSRGVFFFDALRLVAFNVVSVVTTTGFATTDYTLWGPFAVGVFLVLTAVGGCTGSTAGGAKAMRWLLTIRAVKVQLQNLLSPNQIVSVRYEGRRVKDDVMTGVIVFLVFYFLTFSVLSLLLSVMGLDTLTATSGALTALANVGPGVGGIIGPAGNFATLSDPVKILLSIGMYLGRLEILTVVVVLMPSYWRA